MNTSVCTLGSAWKDCGIPGCFDPVGILVLHAKYTCWSITRQTGVCIKGGASSGCSGHDYEDVRRDLMEEDRRLRPGQSLG
jgi:hypothetical protein